MIRVTPMTSEPDRALLGAIGADLDTRRAVVLSAGLRESLDPRTREVLQTPLADVDLVRYSEIQTDSGATAFLVTRAVLRVVLGHLLDRPGADVELLTAERGKPSVAEVIDPPLHFNTSHSETQAVVALTRVGDIGVDVEDISIPDERVVRRALSSDEYEALASMPVEERARAFYRLWTVKEACAKATGIGIGIGMRKVAATLDASGRWREYRWDAIDLGLRVAAAVAVMSPGADEGYGPIAVRRDVLEGLFGVGPGFAPPGAG
jgi:4'-phosphopantetheinyl transferase